MSVPIMEIRDATKIYATGTIGSGKKVVALQDFNLTIDEKPATIVPCPAAGDAAPNTLPASIDAVACHCTAPVAALSAKIWLSWLIT